MSLVFALFLILNALCCHINADTPANCTFEDVHGAWTFYETDRGQDKSRDCSYFSNYTNPLKVRLEFPNNAIDEFGNVGFWTLIYNQGFEVVLNGRKYFAFSYYTQNGQNVTSYCYKTFPGWSHDVGVNAMNWACYWAMKDNSTAAVESSSSVKVKSHQLTHTETMEKHFETAEYKANFDFIKKLNSVQSSWKATDYEFMQGKTISDLVRMAGGKKSRIYGKPKPKPISPQMKKIGDRLPDSFDWRNVSGMNYVSPIRDQGNCGSCYAFASMGMNECRLKLVTNNTVNKVFSTQDVVECSQYSQGCEGGFPYLVSGKYAEDFGLVEETCNPYTGKDGKCSTTTSCTRQYSTRYKYIGGFYGACNEVVMRASLVRNGPIAVSFEVYDDFVHYSGGIYHHTFLKDEDNFKFNPFELTNHVVVIVGYGADPVTLEKYWIVKNSWSEKWGENGFFRIRRGTDECAIESIAVESDIIPQ